MSEPAIPEHLSSGRDEAPFTPYESGASHRDDDEISLLDILVVLAKYKRLILGLPFLTAVLAAGISLLLPNIFTATAKILPPQQSQSTASAMLAQLGNVSGLVGGAAGPRTPNDLYIGMLKSRTVADNLVERLGLVKFYDVNRPSQARDRLAGATSITSGKDSIIVIEVDDKDPKFAAEIANGYAEELYKLTKVLAVTEASQRRLFFEQQFSQARDNLGKAENTARQALQQGGLVKVDDQARAMIETTARLRAQVSVKEVQIGAMRTFATDRNPELLLAQQELESLKRELARIEGAGGIRAAGNAPGGKGLDNLGLIRNLKYNEILYELLAKQYEMARIDEAKDAALIQVLDKAIAPDLKSKPKRSQIVLLWAFAALLAVLLWVFVREGLNKVSGDPNQADRLRALRHYLGWRR